MRSHKNIRECYAKSNEEIDEEVEIRNIIFFFPLPYRRGLSDVWDCGIGSRVDQVVGVFGVYRKKAIQGDQVRSANVQRFFLCHRVMEN